MFDEPKNQPEPPKNLPTEPVDMFAGVEKNEQTQQQAQSAPQIPDALSAGLLKKKEEQVVESGLDKIIQQTPYRADSPIIGKLLLAVFLAVVVGAVGFGGWFLYKKSVEVKKMTPVVEEKNEIDTNVKQADAVPTETQQVPEPEPKTSELPAKINNDKILFGEPVDTDKDGLDDVREKEIGTDPNLADTDNDGLNDGDEVMIWKTDPLNPDSDSDSHVDGKEVKNGYNPLGPGKLFNSSTSTQ